MAGRLYERCDGMDAILLFVITAVTFFLYMFFRLVAPRVFGFDLRKWLMDRGPVFWLLCICLLLVLAYWQVQLLLSEPSRAFGTIVNIVVVGVGISMCFVLIFLSFEESKYRGESERNASE
ncbi:MAG: hypothetical protein GF309_06815 [Candidatus Lokiarchaeota archaeon]|nr:hypothetical protein [Candidatus Lokiarchaeota archaeon]